MATCCLPVIPSEERVRSRRFVHFATRPARNALSLSLPLSCHCEERSDVATCCLLVIPSEERVRVEGSCILQRGEPATLSPSPSLSLVIARSAATWQPAVCLSSRAKNAFESKVRAFCNAASPQRSLPLHPSLLSLRGAQRRGNLLFACHPERRTRSSRRFVHFATRPARNALSLSLPLSCHCEERSDVATCCPCSGERSLSSRAKRRSSRRFVHFATRPARHALSLSIPLSCHCEERSDVATCCPCSGERSLSS